MVEVTYYFNSKSTSNWTDSANMIDGDTGTYASTSSTGNLETLDGNTCPGTNLGTITKVELRVYAYGDGDDRIGLTPILVVEGNEYQTTPGSEAGWGNYNDMTSNPAITRSLESLTGAEEVIAIWGDYWTGQSFTPAINATITYVKLKLKKIGAPAGTLVVSIKATDGEGLPTGEDLTSGSITAGDVPTVATWVQINLTEYNLVAGTKYAIVCRAVDADTYNNLIWLTDVENPYLHGTVVFSDDGGVNWNESPVADFLFDFEKTWVWSWSRIQGLDCKAEFNKVAKGNTMYCAMVEIRVTYTPSGPPGYQYRRRTLKEPAHSGRRGFDETTGHRRGFWPTP